MTIPSHAVVAGLVFTAPLVAFGLPWWVVVPIGTWYGLDATGPDVFTWIDYKCGEADRWEHRPFYHNIPLWCRVFWYRVWRWGYLSHILVDPIFHPPLLPEISGWKWVWAQREFMVVLIASIIHILAWHA